MLSGVTAVVLALDQATKWLVRSRVAPNDSVPVIDGVVHITHVRNTGAAFGLMPGRQPLFALTSIVVVMGILVYLVRTRPRYTWLNVALGLVAGGAVGNLIDRTFIGRVTDFVDLVIIDYPVFNVADMSLIAGVSMLVAWLLFGPGGGTSAEDGCEASLDDTAGPGEGSS